MAEDSDVRPISGALRRRIQREIAAIIERWDGERSQEDAPEITNGLAALEDALRNKEPVAHGELPALRVIEKALRETEELRVAELGRLTEWVEERFDGGGFELDYQVVCWLAQPPEQDDATEAALDPAMTLTLMEIVGLVMATERHSWQSLGKSVPEEICAALSAGLVSVLVRVLARALLDVIPKRVRRQRPKDIYRGARPWQHKMTLEPLPLELLLYAFLRAYWKKHKHEEFSGTPEFILEDAREEYEQAQQAVQLRAAELARGVFIRRP